MAGNELFGVAQQTLLLRLHFHQILQPDAGHVAYGLDMAGRAALAVAEGDGGIPVGRGQRPRQHGFQAREQRFGACEDRFEGMRIHGVSVG